MTNPMICPEHNIQMKGPNSRGNFWHINGKDSQGIPLFCNKSAIELVPPATEEIREPLKERDFEGEARGKTRCRVVCAFIQKEGLRPLTRGDKAIINQLVDFIFTSD